MVESKPASRKSLAIELIAVTTALVVAANLLMRMKSVAVIGPLISTIVAVLFLYTPILMLWKRHRPIDFLDHGLRAYSRSFLFFLITSAIIFPPFLLATHGWERIVLGHQWAGVAGLPRPLEMIGFQLLLVALPEEFYFRGYFQSAMNRMFERRWNVLGAKLGWGWILTALVFAFAHSAVTFRWWHFAIFFPALLFGYLRERTGTVTAPILFHAACNLIMYWIARCYI